ncbi:hypothetical protein J19TS2_16430 [Cohnella xylanilytica]|nr:hypothetical protein J19TS2_16430 [Cohnella xylanilytica]
MIDETDRSYPESDSAAAICQTSMRLSEGPALPPFMPPLRVESVI